MKWYDDYLDAGGVDITPPRQQEGRPGQHRREGHGLHRQVGHRPHREVLSPAEKPHKHGLICRHSASDIVCRPASWPAGIGLQVFMTGRGTPTAGRRPGHQGLLRNEMKEHWFDLIDVNAGPIATGEKTIADVGRAVPPDSGRGQRREAYSDQYGFHNDLCIFNPAPIT